MAEYEMVREIKNLCRNNQMRDVLIEEIEVDDPEAYVRNLLRGKQVEITAAYQSDGAVLIDAVCDGLIQSFSFTRL